MGLWTQWGKERVGQIRTDTCTLPCIKSIASGKLLYNIGSSAQCSVLT